MYVPNVDYDTLSQYDIGAGGALTPKTPESVGTGSSPAGVAVSPDGGSVYVTNENGDSISQYDIGANGAVAPKTPATLAAGDRPTADRGQPRRRLGLCHRHER